jgi:hypothetical protein
LGRRPLYRTQFGHVTHDTSGLLQQHIWQFFLIDVIQARKGLELQRCAAFIFALQASFKFERAFLSAHIDIQGHRILRTYFLKFLDSAKQPLVVRIVFGAGILAGCKRPDC